MDVRHNKKSKDMCHKLFTQRVLRFIRLFFYSLEITHKTDLKYFKENVKLKAFLDH